MTAILSANVQPSLAHSLVYQMLENDEEAWRRQYYQQQIPVPAGQWVDSRAMQMSGLHDTDFRMFQPPPTDFQQQYSGTAGSMLTPHMGYAPEGTWSADMDTGTPSTTGFTSDTTDAYKTLRTLSNHFPVSSGTHDRASSRAQSPPNFQEGPNSLQLYLNVQDGRPAMNRSTTAPEASRRVGAADVKPAAGSDEEEDDSVPGGEPSSSSNKQPPRGRKRQRIPHTAVERRYRENLNAHLERLRQTVPSLVSKRAAGASAPGDGLGDGAKPSKCEILTGAIGHIAAQAKEVAALRGEVKALRAQMEEMERWYGPQGCGLAK